MNHPQQYPHSAVYPSGKQTNTRDESCAHTMMNNFPSVVHYVLSHFKTLEAQTQALQLNSVYSREKVNIFRELKTCTVWKFCRTMTDLVNPASSHRIHKCLSVQSCRRGGGCICSRSLRRLRQGRGRSVFHRQEL